MEILLEMSEVRTNGILPLPRRDPNLPYMSRQVHGTAQGGGFLPSEAGVALGNETDFSLFGGCFVRKGKEWVPFHQINNVNFIEK